MNVPPVAIVQARMGSTRLPNKMLLPLAGEILVFYAWRAATVAFGMDNTVAAIPAGTDNDKLANYLTTVSKLPVFRWDGPENDVLGRFWHCAHRYRWHPDSVIVRITPDDCRKDVAMLRRVACGERLPVEQGGEAFTLAMLDEAPRYYARPFPNGVQPPAREHITNALFTTLPPPPPPGIWSVDTPEDYEAMRKVME